MILFEATTGQVQQLIVNAAQASSPGGLGHLHYRKNQVFIPEQFKVENGFVADWIGGRRVGLTILRVRDNRWQIPSPLVELSPTHQTWAEKYQKWEDLIASVPDIKIISE